MLSQFYLLYNGQLNRASFTFHYSRHRGQTRFHSYLRYTHVEHFPSARKRMKNSKYVSELDGNGQRREEISVETSVG